MKKSPILVSVCCLLMGGYASANDSAAGPGVNLDRPIAAPSRPSPARPAPSRPSPEPSRPAPYHPAPSPRPAPFHPSPAPRPIPRPAPGPHPGPIAPRPSPGPHPSPGIPHHGVEGPGFHNGGARPGYTNGFRYDYNRRPEWFRAGIDFPIFAWFVVSGWQCTAFDANQEAFAAGGVSQDQAAYNALYDCGGDEGPSECYIPEGYCQLR